MDALTEKQIWERVRKSDRISAEYALLPQQLAELMGQERTSAAACEQLAARTGGTDCNALRRIKAQCENRICRLKTLFFLLTGSRINPKQSPIGFHEVLCDALREEILLMQTLRESYAKTKEAFPCYAETLQPLQTESEWNCKTLTEILQRKL